MKIKMKFLKSFGGHIESMSDISKIILCIGQPILFAAIAALVGYIIYYTKFTEQNSFYEVYRHAVTFFDSAAAGVCVLWGGALFIDCLEKNGERTR